MRWKYRKVKRPAVAGIWTQDTFHLSHQCSATEPQQLDNHQPSQILYMYCKSGTECLSHTPREDWEGWWLSAWHGSVAGYWRLKTEVSWVRLPVPFQLPDYNIYNFFISSMRQGALSMKKHICMYVCTYGSQRIIIQGIDVGSEMEV